MSPMWAKGLTPVSPKRGSPAQNAAAKNEPPPHDSPWSHIDFLGLVAYT
jgi:hypothetical protein